MEEGLYNIQFEQHWLQAENDRQVVVNKQIGKQAVYKALIESTAQTGASILQVVRFTSEATIIGINTSREWYYESCSACIRKVTKNNGTPECVDPQLNSIATHDAMQEGWNSSLMTY
ncbi:transmembrane emp24 domain-containing protein p24beta2-like protein [Tanacetum coccineum]